MAEINLGVSELSREPLVAIEDILSVQAVAMGIMAQARTRKVTADERRHSFSMRNTQPGLDTPEPAIYDGSTDTYLSFTTRRQGYGQWRMHISFLSYVMEKDRAACNTREQFLFDWMRNSNRMAWTQTVVANRDLPTEPQRIVVDRHQLTSVECKDLEARMRLMSEQVASRLIRPSLELPSE